MALEDVLARVPGLAGYLGQNQFNQQQAMVGTQNLAGQLGILSNLNQQQQRQQFQSAIQDAQTPEDQLAVATKFMTPDVLGKTVQASQDRQAQIAATREATMGRLQQASTMAQMMHEVRMQGLTNQADKNAETTRHNQEMEDLKGQYNDMMKNLYGMGPGGTNNLQPTIDAIGQGDMPSRMSSRNPVDRNIMNEVVKQYAGQDENHPAYDATAYPTKQKTMNDFSTGKPGSQVKSFNVGLAHLGTLSDLTDALNNSDFPTVNKIANMVQVQTGSSVAPTNFNAAKQIVGNEIVRAIVGAGGGSGDREKAQATVDAASTPQALKGVIDTYKSLMVGQLRGLEQQYKSGTRGKKDFSEKYLSPDARKLYLSHDVPAPAAAPTNSKGWTLHQDAQGNKAYVSPDGKQFEAVQ